MIQTLKGQQSSNCQENTQPTEGNSEERTLKTAWGNENGIRKLTEERQKERLCKYLGLGGLGWCLTSFHLDGSTGTWITSRYKLIPSIWTMQAAHINPAGILGRGRHLKSTQLLGIPTGVLAVRSILGIVQMDEWTTPDGVTEELLIPWGRLWQIKH